MISNWLKIAKCLHWSKFPKIEINLFNDNKFYWFPDGKIDLYHNFILQHPKNKKAIITICGNKTNSYTYEELDILVDKLFFFISQKKNKVKKILIHSSSSIESAISMLMCVKLGIYFSVVFEDLPISALEKRINLFKPDLVLSRKGISKIDRIKKKNFLYLDFKSFWKYKIKIYKRYKSKVLNPKNNFFCLFTSGSTGEPKGIVHSYGGYTVYANYTCRKQFGMKKKSIVFTASDAGWINGHTYALFGPLSIGSKTILIDKPVNILNAEILDLVIKQNPTIIYLPVTLIRLLKLTSTKRTYNFTSLETVGSMGEPLAPKVGEWFLKKFNLVNNAIINTYFQTETGGIISSPKYTENKRSSPPGCVGKIINPLIKIKELGKKNKKEFVIKTKWPGCMTDVINGKKVWNNYFDKDGYFRLFDLATLVKKNIYIHGRIDDVVNIRGHRIGSEEIESTILEINSIIEVSAISIEDKLEGAKFYLFIKSDKNKKLDKKINKKIIENFGSFALPAKIIYLNNLPKTKSGKILRRLLREVILNPKNPKYGDLSTVQNNRELFNLALNIKNEKN